MTGIWKPKTFTDEEVREAIESVKAQGPDLWDAFVKYQRLDEGYQDEAGYQVLNKKLTALLYKRSQGMEAADLTKLLFQMRQVARQEAGVGV